LHELVDPSVPAQPVCLRDNVWLGFDVCVLPGVTIGEGSVVGARSVVCSDVPAYTLVAGNPARAVRALPRSAP
jgi:acetyltransferase-like isoleucine patch superfamily enzyme